MSLISLEDAQYFHFARPLNDYGSLLRGATGNIIHFNFRDLLFLLDGDVVCCVVVSNSR